MVTYMNGTKLLTASDLPAKWNLLAGTKDYSNFTVGGNVETASDHSFEALPAEIATDIVHMWGEKTAEGMLKTTQKISLTKGSYTFSAFGRHNQPNTDETYPIFLFSDYTDQHQGHAHWSGELTGKWQKITGTFTIDDAGEYGNFRLGNPYNTAYPLGSLYFCNLKLERGTVATDWMPAIADLQLKSKMGGKAPS